MPKLKTKKGVVKRFKLTKGGKVKYPTCGKSHLATSKKAKRLRHLRKAKTVDGKKDIKFIKRMLPYG
ncbi:MAG: 50S ribosomal protein L35 [Candidatus Omnitrophica bacterium]|jgi:large subunit ribosomal protein L35|nr:50S ribosomal protein L35 [Candidatus Omnitrophota bacterium]